jgi:hypothetical protein
LQRVEVDGDRQVDMSDLAGGMDAGVGPAGDGQPGRHVGSGDDSEGILDLGLDGAAAGLAGPAEEVGSVVGQVEPDPDRVRLAGGDVRDD